MSHVVHPYAHRLGIIRDWKSRWFSPKNKFRSLLKADVLIREFLDVRFLGQYVASVDIERSEKVLRVIIDSSRPGMIIGRNGEGSVKLKADLLKMMAKNKILGNEELRIDIKEIKSPESNATLMAQMIAEGLEKRMPFRRVCKQLIEKVMANRDVKGIKICLSGRLGGAEIAREEKMKKGRVPLQTLRSDVDYCHHEARMTYGRIGIKVWIYRGDIFEKKTPVLNNK